MNLISSCWLESYIVMFGYSHGTLWVVATSTTSTFPVVPVQRAGAVVGLFWELMNLRDCHNFSILSQLRQECGRNSIWRISKEHHSNFHNSKGAPTTTAAITTLQGKLPRMSGSWPEMTKWAKHFGLFYQHDDATVHHSACCLFHRSSHRHRHNRRHLHLLGFTQNFIEFSEFGILISYSA